MKLLVSSFILTALFGMPHAFGSDYPILGTYRASAEHLVSQTKQAQTADEIVVIDRLTRDLVVQGSEVMKLYAEKNPNCSAQFDVFLAELPTMETKTVDEVHERYHNGTGLPAAPKHCYFGRSQVVHPVMNLIRLKGTFDENVRDQVAEDFEEVIEHLARIQKNLDQPPN